MAENCRKFLRVGNVVEANIDDEKVMMCVETGNYFGLNAVAARVWDHLAEPISMSDLIGLLTQEFDVDAQECRRTVEPFIEQLIESKLISFES